MSSVAQARRSDPVPEEGSGTVASERIGRFELVEEIGRGSMGIVYLARDPMIGRWVAVKKLTGIKGKALDPETVRRLLINEARNVGALEHPGILTVFDIVEGRDGQVEALAMEYVGGRSLRQCLDDAMPMSLKYISEVLSAVAEALDHAHENGCIHRDVKPANVLLGNDGVVKIADFGIAALRGEDLATELRNLGTPNYLAPERVMGQPGDQRTDIYSLGVMLYELLTRRLPFEATSIAELVQKIVQEEPTPPERFAPELMPGLAEILARSLAKEPEERYETAGAMAAAVRQIVSAQAALNDTVPTPGPTPVPRPVPLAPLTAETVSPSPERRLQGVEKPAPRAEPESLGLLEPTLATPIEDLLKSPLDGEIEEVEWESVVAAPLASEPLSESGATPRAAAGSLRALVDRGSKQARSLLPPAQASVRRGAAAVKERPILAAAIAFALALPMLLMAFGGSDEATPVTRFSGETASMERHQAARLQVQSRALFDAGDTRAALAALHQADLLFPLSPEVGRSRQLLAAEREVDRLDRIDRVAQEAHLEIARADFTRARASIARLAELEAPDETLKLLESSLAQGRRRVLRARQARMVEPEPEIRQPLPAPRRQRVAVIPTAAPRTGPATLRIEFSSARPRGVLTVFAGTTQVLNRRYRFVEKKNFLIRKNTSGSFQESIELPEGTRDLRLYLTQPKQPTQHRPIDIEIPPGESRTLRLQVEADGKFVVRSG